MEPQELKISVDAIPAIAEMASLLSEISELAGLTAKCLEQGFHLVALDGDLPAAPAANNCRTVFKPTEKLILLVAALRACNRDARVLVGSPFDTHRETPL